MNSTLESVVPLAMFIFQFTGPLQVTSTGWAGARQGHSFGVFDPYESFTGGYFLQTEKYTEQHRGFPVQVKTILHICILFIDLL